MLQSDSLSEADSMLEVNNVHAGSRYFRCVSPRRNERCVARVLATAFDGARATFGYRRKILMRL